MKSEIEELIEELRALQHHEGSGSDICQRASDFLERLSDASKTKFYRVQSVKQPHGIGLHTALTMLQKGRKVRWQSTAAEYGLIESFIVGRYGMPGTLQVMSERGACSVYLEQIKEVALTKEEAQALGLGWPS